MIHTRKGEKKKKTFNINLFLLHCIHSYIRSHWWIDSLIGYKSCCTACSLYRLCPHWRQQKDWESWEYSHGRCELALRDRDGEEEEGEEKSEMEQWLRGLEVNGKRANVDERQSSRRLENDCWRGWKRMRGRVLWWKRNIIREAITVLWLRFVTSI